MTDARPRERTTEEDTEGLTHEIADLRKRLHRAIDDDEVDLRVLAQGMNALTRAVATQHRLSPRKSRDLADNIAAVLKDVADIMYGPDA